MHLRIAAFTPFTLVELIGPDLVLLLCAMQLAQWYLFHPHASCGEYKPIRDVAGKKHGWGSPK